MMAELVELDSLMARSDVVSIHAPSLPSTRAMIGARQLKLMQDGAAFINTARGAVVDEAALIAELQTGRIHAVIDVTDPEIPGGGVAALQSAQCVPDAACGGGRRHRAAAAGADGGRGSGAVRAGRAAGICGRAGIAGAVGV